MRKYLLPLTALAALVGVSSAFAATTINDSFDAKIKIIAECKIKQLADLNFGSQGVLDSTRTTSAALDIQCSNGVGYAISFSSSSSVATVNDAMVLGTEDVAYTAVLSATSGIGNGNAQSYTINGTVLAQTTPSAGDYVDTQIIYVTY